MSLNITLKVLESLITFSILPIKMEQSASETTRFSERQSIKTKTKLISTKLAPDI
jgi:hypothetical protein